MSAFLIPEAKGYQDTNANLSFGPGMFTFMLAVVRRVEAVNKLAETKQAQWTWLVKTLDVLASIGFIKWLITFSMGYANLVGSAAWLVIAVLLLGVPFIFWVYLLEKSVKTEKNKKQEQK